MRFNPVKIALSLAIALPLAGCFDSEPETSKDAPVEAVKSEIRVAMMVPPRTGLSPLSDDAFKLSRWSTAETLINLTPEAIAEPMLATKWQQLDEKTWQFTIREGVTFHDGSQLDAEAVVHALNKAQQAAPKPRILDGITWEVSVVANNKIQIVTNTVDPLLPSRLSSPQLAILAPSAYQENGRVIPTKAGTGPFVLTEINGAVSATLVRNDAYWGEKAKIDTILAEYVPDGFARAAALRTGEADVVEAVPVSQIAMIDESLLNEVAMPRTNTLYLNNTTGVFADIEMRKIVAATIDRKQIVEMVYENHADIAQGLLGPALAWAQPLRGEKEVFEPGLKANGEKITIGTFTDRAELPEVAALVKQQLEAVGFVVELDIREYGQIENDALAGKFDIFILSRGTVLDSGDPIAYMLSDFGCAGSFNLGQFCNAEVDKALNFADQQPLGAERNKAIIAAEAEILSRYAAIPLLHERVIQGETSRVSSVERDPRERRLITVSTEVK